MSIVEARVFRDRINRSKDLQNEVEQLLRRQAESGIVELARRLGYQVTAEDIFAVIATSRLTEFEIKMIGNAAGLGRATCSRLQRELVPAVGARVG
jgi:hypothetical protein